MSELTLRDEIADKLLSCIQFVGSGGHALALADRILALPEMREAVMLLLQKRGDRAMARVAANMRKAFDQPTKP